MIEEFAVPEWARLLARMAGRHVRRSTRRPRAPRAADVAAEPAPDEVEVLGPEAITTIYPDAPTLPDESGGSLPETVPSPGGFGTATAISVRAEPTAAADPFVTEGETTVSAGDVLDSGRLTRQLVAASLTSDGQQIVTEPALPFVADIEPINTNPQPTEELNQPATDLAVVAGEPQAVPADDVEGMTSVPPATAETVADPAIAAMPVASTAASAVGAVALAAGAGTASLAAITPAATTVAATASAIALAGGLAVATATDAVVAGGDTSDEPAEPVVEVADVSAETPPTEVAAVGEVDLSSLPDAAAVVAEPATRLPLRVEPEEDVLVSSGDAAVDDSQTGGAASADVGDAESIAAADESTPISETLSTAEVADSVEGAVAVDAEATAPPIAPGEAAPVPEAAALAMPVPIPVPVGAEPAADAVDGGADATAGVVSEAVTPPSSTPAAEVAAVVAETPAPADPVPAAVTAASVAKQNAASVLGPAVKDEYNRTGIDFRRPMPRPKVRGRVIDFHSHLFARHHADDWFEAADHYGTDVFLTMTPLEEATALARDFPKRLRFIAVPSWGDASSRWVDNWLNRIEAFYNLGSRINKFHASPGTMVMRGCRLDAPAYKPLFAELKARRMVIMTHIGDPDTWYNGRYAADPAKFGTRDEHYRMWENLLEEYRGTPWVGAHLGGNPEDLPRLQRLLDTFPDLMLDCSATRWMVREVSARRDAAREFFIRNQDRILYGSDQVSGNDRQFDFLASRFWCHRKLWETAYSGPSPVIDPDVPADAQPVVHGLALPDVVLQKIYHDNATKLLGKIGMGFDEE